LPRAEQLAAEYLTRTLPNPRPHWRNRWCELDIVARKDGRRCFVEVKYRKKIHYGFALNTSRATRSTVSPRRTSLNQAHNYSGAFQIDIIAVEGNLVSPTSGTCQRYF